jgi:hypothetical protein
MACSTHEGGEKFVHFGRKTSRETMIDLDVNGKNIFFFFFFFFSGLPFEGI